MTSRERHLWVCYRLSEPEYETILQHQGGVCAGCSKPPFGARLAVDHCHKTGRIRGLLCWLCNRAIGILRDNAKAATRLGAYLDSPPAPAALGKETFGLIGQAKASKKKKVYGPPLPQPAKKGKDAGLSVVAPSPRIVRSRGKVRTSGTRKGVPRSSGGRKLAPQGTPGA